jgi:arabinofuranan 3-O-arabinosyltransferase
MLPAGQQELLISPGAAFIADGVQLAGPLAGRIRAAATVPAQTGTWSNADREVSVPASETSRVLVVAESINPGWVAHRADGTRLTPVTVNGWQQGWVLPPGTEGPVTLAFASNALYRAGLIGGLALLPLLALLAFVPVRRRVESDTPARVWAPGRVSASVAVLAVGAAIAGVAGIVVFGIALGVRYLLRNRERLCDAVTVTTTAGGLILAGAVLSQNPWRSVGGYVGHSAGVQLLALISVAMLAASVVEDNRSRFGVAGKTEP